MTYKMDLFTAYDRVTYELGRVRTPYSDELNRKLDEVVDALASLELTAGIERAQQDLDQSTRMSQEAYERLQNLRGLQGE
jgi:hypothetical protein